jgi:hypothetical protein
MLDSFERLRVVMRLTLTEETLRSSHRFELEYICVQPDGYGQARSEWRADLPPP